LGVKTFQVEKMNRLRAFLLLMLGVTIVWAYFQSDAPHEEPPVTVAHDKPPAEIAKAVKLVVVVPDADEPVFLTTAPGDATGRLFVVEKPGKVRIVRGGKIVDRPFLDVSGRIRTRHDEQGLLGLAFHPKYAENRRLFVNFTDEKGDTRVVEYKAGKDDPDRVDSRTEREIFFIDQPWANHNGGHLAFGPDGKLYVGLGDGGMAGDPLEAAQDPKNLLGKMLRFDVDGGPVAEDGRPKPEVWQSGLRNPWRYAFDRKNGDLYIADVGQNKYEEVSVVPFADAAGKNFGWDIVEGIAHCFEKRNCDQTGLVQPVLEYGHTEGCSITGGYVYRGKELPELDGCYFYADYCSALLRSFRYRDGKAVDTWDWRVTLDPDFKLATITSFGEDAAGELYLLSRDGPVYRFTRR
jgi:glucose/arabinose dehydrogenase